MTYRTKTTKRVLTKSFKNFRVVLGFTFLPFFASVTLANDFFVFGSNAQTGGKTGYVPVVFHQVLGEQADRCSGISVNPTKPEATAVFATRYGIFTKTGARGKINLWQKGNWWSGAMTNLNRGYFAFADFLGQRLYYWNGSKFLYANENPSDLRLANWKVYWASGYKMALACTATGLYGFPTDNPTKSSRLVTTSTFNVNQDFVTPSSKVLFAATSSGLEVSYTQKGVPRFAKDPSYPSTPVYSVVGGTANVFIGTDRGLWYREVNKHFSEAKFARVDDGLLNNRSIYSICFDTNDNFWVGTDAGVFVRLKSEVHFQKTNLPLYTNVVAEALGQIWVGTDREGVWSTPMPSG